MKQLYRKLLQSKGGNSNLKRLVIMLLVMAIVTGGITHFAAFGSDDYVNYEVPQEQDIYMLAPVAIDNELYIFDSWDEHSGYIGYAPNNDNSCCHAYIYLGYDYSYYEPYGLHASDGGIYGPYNEYQCYYGGGINDAPVYSGQNEENQEGEYLCLSSYEYGYSYCDELNGALEYGTQYNVLPELEYYYVYREPYGYVRLYRVPGGIDMEGAGYMNDAPISIVPFSTAPTLPIIPPDPTNIITISPVVMTFDQLQLAINSVPSGQPADTAHRIVLGADITGGTLINVTGNNRHIILDSDSDTNRSWFNTGTDRHINISGVGITLELRNVSLTRTPNLLSNGGGVNLVGGRFMMNHPQATISNNRSGNGGGLIVPMSGIGVATWIEIRAGRIYDNVATSRGGGIDMDGWQRQVFLILTGGEIHNNTAVNGGGVGICCNTQIYIAGTAQVHNNLATSQGGGLNMSWNHLTVLGGQIRDNIAGTGGGGFVASGPTRIAGGLITGNRAVGTAAATNVDGGGILSTGDVTFWGGTITNNHASGSGGGMALSGPTRWLDIEAPLNISGNRARLDGGGIWMTNATAQNTINNTQMLFTSYVTINNNSAGRNGGGIFFQGAAARQLTLQGAQVNNNGIATTVYTTQAGAQENISTESGGGIFVAQGTLQVNTGGQVNGNRARVSGGGISNAGANSTTEIAGGTINDNRAVHAAINNANGGGIHAVAGNLIFRSGNITNNHASGNGGGIWVQGNSRWLDIDAPLNITGNRARLDGGGIFFSNTAAQNTTNNTAVLVNSHVSINNNTAGANGGGIFLQGAAARSLTLQGGSINNNGHQATVYVTQDNATQSITTQNGGGVFIAQGTLTAEHGNINNNYAVDYSGAVHLSTTTSNIVMQEAGTTNINNNRARIGGAIHWTQGNWTINANNGPVSITGNTATEIGGGIALSNARVLTIPAGFTIHDNTAYNSGGGIHVLNSTLTINGSTITENEALSTAVGASSGGGGVFVTGFSSLTVEPDSLIAYNDASTGGGVRLFQSANYHPISLTMNGGTIRDNEALYDGPTGAWGGGGVDMSRNVTGGSLPSFVMHNGSIDNNISNWSGGGVNVLGGSVFTMHDGSISGNILLAPQSGTPPAGNGAGVHITGGGTFDLHNGSISNNLGVNFGGGVHVFNSSMNMHPGASGNGAVISGNTAIIGGGISVTGGAATSSSLVMLAGTISGNGHPQPNPYPNPTPGFEIVRTRQGGGVFVRDAGSTFDMYNDSIVTGNMALQGGGIFVASGTLTVNSGEITDNEAVSTLDAPYVAKELDPETGAVITAGVYNGSGGGIFVAAGGTADISNADITDNHADEMGGGIFTELYQYNVAELDIAGVYSNLIIDDTVLFDDNTAGQGSSQPPTNAYDWTNIPGDDQNGTQSTHDHPINNYDINFRRPPVKEFSFHKTTSDVYIAPNLTVIADITPFLLEGAYFSLFRFVGSGSIPDLVTTYPSPNWIRVEHDLRSSGLIGTPITMDLTLDSVYHLVETLAPVEFQMPFGQWRIAYDDIAEEFIVVTVGGTAPTFMYLDGYFYVGNVRSMILPLTGGVGTSMFTAMGIFILLVGTVWLLILHRRKARKAFVWQ